MTPDDVDLLFEGLARLEAAGRALIDGPREADMRPQGSRFFSPYSGPSRQPSDIEPALAIHAPSRFEWLVDAYDLSPFDVDVLLVALAPDVDRRFARLFDRALGGTSSGRPTVGLAIDLLCSSHDERLRARARFGPGAPLVGSDLLRLAAAGAEGLGLLGRAMVLDPQISRLLLAEDYPDDELSGIIAPARASAAATAVFEPFVEDALTAFAGHARTGSPLRLYLHGPHASGKRRCAAVVAAQLGMGALAIDLHRGRSGDDVRTPLRRALREASFLGAVPYLSRLDELAIDERLDVLDQIAGYRGSVLIGGAIDRRGLGPSPDGITEVALGIQPAEGRRRAWARGLAAIGAAVDDPALAALAGRYRLTPGQIVSAIETACGNSAQGTAPDPAEVFTRLRLAAASVAGFDLTPLAQRLEPTARWDDIVLPDDAVRQLREICSRVDAVYHVLGEWGFGARLSRGRGTSALFAGTSGTGKTMAAEIVATELGLDLYRIDLAGVVSKYIGETEKNLDRIFAAAEGANAILLFDEADALFGKRSEVRDAHDRYANIEISYLLAKMELFEGLTILATNLRQNLDEAFVRRLAFTVHFPFPDEASRAEIWRRIWPSAVPLAPEVDLAVLARDHRLSGGNIRNAALAAAYLAAAEDSPVAMRHLRHAVRREYQKMGSAGMLAASSNGAGVSAVEAEAVA